MRIQALLLSCLLQISTAAVVAMCDTESTAIAVDQDVGIAPYQGKVLVVTLAPQPIALPECAERSRGPTLVVRAYAQAGATTLYDVERTRLFAGTSCGGEGVIC